MFAFSSARLCLHVFDSSVRKGNDELRVQLGKIIVPIYCLAVDQSDDERKQKLVKVETLTDRRTRFNSDRCDISTRVLSHAVTRSLGEK